MSFAIKVWRFRRVFDGSEVAVSIVCNAEPCGSRFCGLSPFDHVRPFTFELLQNLCLWRPGVVFDGPGVASSPLYLTHVAARVIVFCAVTTLARREPQRETWRLW